MATPSITRSSLAWRGFVTTSGGVIAWPTLLAQHNDFHRTFHTTDDSFAARWRQWNPGEAPDFDPGASPEDKAAVNTFLGI